MLPFELWHSVLEMKLYMHRFLHLVRLLNDMMPLVFPKCNQYGDNRPPIDGVAERSGASNQYDTLWLTWRMDVSGATKQPRNRCHTGKGGKTIKRARDLVLVTQARSSGTRPAR